MRKAEAYWPLILFLALVKFVLPLFLQSPVYELQRDEFLYYQQGQHLALGYLENPPLLSYLGWISSWFGGSESWIKLWPCIFGAATVVITCLICAELGGHRFAQFLAGIGIIASAYLRVHFLFQPNILDIFFWTLAIYFLLRYIHGNEHSIFGLTISLALGWWGKYSVLFMAIAIVLGLLLTKHRSLFLKKNTWLAIGIGLLIIVPNLVWQYQHNWPLIHHMQELKETQLNYLSPGDFIKEQVLMLLPVALVWIAGLIWVLRKPHYRVVGIVYILVIVLLMLGSGKSYYALGAYPMLLAAGGVAWQNITERKRWLRPVILALPIILFLPFIPMLLPVWKPVELSQFYEKYEIGKTGILKWEDQKDHPLPQDFADMLGWEELATKSQAFYHSLPKEEKENTIIYCSNYGQAGSHLYYSRDPQFKDKVISTNGSFLLWIPSQLSFKNLLFISEDEPDDNELFTHFEKHSVIDSVTNPLARVFGNKIIYYQSIDSTGLNLAQQGLEKEKQKFRR